MSKEKAENIFYEKIPSCDQITMPDQKSFVKFIDCSALLDEVPMLNKTLRHCVSPQVKKMQAELQ